MESTPPLAALALAITSQDRTSLGLGEDPNIAATDDFDTTVERLTALLLIRVVAVVSKAGKLPDFSTTTICRAALLENKPWPEPITDTVIEQLRRYVSSILVTYNDTPYHGVPHAYHVTLSLNKMLDLILNTDIQGNRLHPTFGLRNDPLMHLVLIFSAIIHDAEHRGIPNRQLVLEDDPLAILYNDQSIAENRSLFLAFAELLKDDYKDLRNAMFLSTDEYRRFRKATVNLILTTDIASPERTQVGKSKWKEAFGDPFETVERKVRKEIQRKQSMSSGARPAKITAGRRASACSMYSELTSDIHEGDEFSPSVTPDSSYNGDDYDSIDDDLSQDGMIVSSKPFSNVVSSSQLNSSQPTRKVEPVGKLGAAQLGYEPDTPSNNDLEYGDNSSLTPKPAGSSHSVGAGAKPLSPSKSSNAVPRSNKKALPHLPHHGSKNTEFKKQAVRNMSMSDFVSDIEREATAQSLGVNGDHMSKQMAKFQRRFSTSVVTQGATPNNKKYKYRLGILRAVDLSGEAIETYSRGSATGAVSMAGMSIRTPSIRSPSGTIVDADEFDELKVTVVMEQLMTACDVAHNLQSWDHMVKWSNKLFLELKRAHKQGKGGDPKNNWFENQIGFLESYLLPLARRLEDAGVFGDVIGPVFARIVESNRDRWLTDGLGVTSAIILEGRKQYPVEGDFAS
jgi:3'5'-cyclic nucleotide phosphodiesterase